MDNAETKPISLRGAELDTSETLAGKRDEAPADGVMDTDILTQSLEKKCRAGDFHSAFIADKVAVK